MIIFGGAGFVGKNLANSLANQNWQVTVVTRRAHRNRDLLVLPTLKLVEEDIQSEGAVAKLVKGADAVVNLVGILHESRKFTFDDVHVRLPEVIAQACLQANVGRLVHISSIGADVDAPSAYLQSKGRGDQAVFEAINQGLSAMVIRSSIIFGPHDSFSRQFERLLALAKGIFLLVSPDSYIQPVYVRDVVNCIVHALTERKLQTTSCDVAGPEVFTLIELVRLIDRLTDRRHRIIGLNPFLSKCLASILQFVPGKPITPDNLLSLQVPNVCTEKFPDPYGVQPAYFAETAKAWLRPRTNRLDAYRARAGR